MSAAIRSSRTPAAGLVVLVVVVGAVAAVVLVVVGAAAAVVEVVAGTAVLAVVAVAAAVVVVVAAGRIEVVGLGGGDATGSGAHAAAAVRDATRRTVRVRLRMWFAFRCSRPLNAAISIALRLLRSYYERARAAIERRRGGGGEPGGRAPFRGGATRL
ncbi:MAG: hypothetical protein ACKVWR_07410 [Acidimicrobiales bacterium]